MKKILLSLFGIITLGLVNFGNCENYSFTLEKSCYSVGECSSSSHVFVPITSGSVISCSVVNIPNMSNVSGDITFVVRSEFIEGLSNECGIETWDSFYNTWYNGSWNYGDGLQESFEFIFDSFGDSDTSLQDISLSMDLNSVQSINGQVKYGVSCVVSNSFSFNSCNLLSSDDSVYTGDCQQNTGDIQRSSLYINDIQHLGSENINITIPEEIDWDYTGNDEEFNIWIEGYNVDTEYIDNIIRTQNYKPTSEDFTELVKMLAPYSKIIIFCVFLFIVWAWIKKPFKSKKF